MLGADEGGQIVQDGPVARLLRRGFHRQRQHLIQKSGNHIVIVVEIETQPIILLIFADIAAVVDENFQHDLVVMLRVPGQHLPGLLFHCVRQGAVGHGPFVGEVWKGAVGELPFYDIYLVVFHGRAVETVAEIKNFLG